MTKELIDQILRDIGLEKIEFEGEEARHEILAKGMEVK